MKNRFHPSAENLLEDRVALRRMDWWDNLFRSCYSHCNYGFTTGILAFPSKSTKRNFMGIGEGVQVCVGVWVNVGVGVSVYVGGIGVTVGVDVARE